MAVRRYLDWLREAEDDLSAAKDLLRLGRYSKACFFAQQAAEKALKALLIKRAGVFETTHSVLRLLEVLGEHGLEVPSELFEKAEALDRLY
ncbi:DNA-binding protein, partial [Candidatus Bathyarchaeota archaeon]